MKNVLNAVNGSEIIRRAVKMKCPRCKEIRNTMNAKTHIEREGMCYSCKNNIDTSIHRGRL